MFSRKKLPGVSRPMMLPQTDGRVVPNVIMPINRPFMGLRILPGMKTGPRPVKFM